MPRNNQEFWAKKLQGNKVRDRYVNRELRKMGWVPVLSLSKHRPRVGLRELKPAGKVAGRVKRRLTTK